MGKPTRIVAVVVAEEETNNFTVIDGSVFVDRLQRTLHAYEFTPAGINHVIEVLLGNDEVPLRCQESEADDE